MKKFIEILKEKNTIKALEITYMLLGEPNDGTPEEKKEVTKEAFFGCVVNKMKRDEEVKEAFCDLAYELAEEALKEELYKIIVEGK